MLPLADWKENPCTDFDQRTSGERRDVDVVALPVHGLDLGEAELLHRLAVLHEELEEVGVLLELLRDEQAEVHHDVVRHALLVERRPQLGERHGLLHKLWRSCH